MICPHCAFDGEPAAAAGSVVVCASCGASCVALLEGDGTGDALDADPSTEYRRACALDTAALSAEELARLRKARGRIAHGKP